MRNEKNNQMLRNRWIFKKACFIHRDIGPVHTKTKLIQIKLTRIHVNLFSSH